MKFSTSILALVASVVTTVVNGQTQCGTTADINITGSTTVAPLAAAWSVGYKKDRGCTNAITTSSTGSSNGAKGVCTVNDIGLMSREWRVTEALPGAGDLGYEYTCVANPSRVAIQMPVALDGVVVFVGKGSAAEKCLLSLPNGGLTVSQLRWMFSANITVEQPPNSDGDITTRKWSELKNDPTNCPNVDILVAGPSSIYGTHDYFKEVIFQASAEVFRAGTTFLADNSPELRDYVFNTKNSIGFFGYPFFSQNGGALYGVPIGGIAPTKATILDGTYQPFSRRIFMNFLKTSLGATKCYMEYGFSVQGGSIALKNNFIALPSAEIATVYKRLTGPDCPKAVVAPVAAPVAVAPVPAAPVAAPTPALKKCTFLNCGPIRRILGLCKCAK